MKIKELQNETELKENLVKDKVFLMIHKTDCPFCEKAKPWLEQYQEKYPSLLFLQINKDKLPNLLDQFNLRMYPTFLFIEKGVVKDTFYGDTNYNKIVDFIEKNNSN